MRRGYRTFTTIGAAAIACGLCAGALIFVRMGLFPAVGTAVLVLWGMPAFLMITGLTAGFVPMLLCLAMALLALANAGGLLPAGFGALYLLPAALVYMACLRREVPFWKSCGLLAGTLAGAQLVMYLWAWRLTGGAVYPAAGQAAAAAVEALPLRNQLFYALLSVGVLQVPEALREGVTVAANGALSLSDALVTELLAQVRSWAEQLTRWAVPALMLTGSALQTLLGLGLGIDLGGRAAQRRAFRQEEETQPIPTLNMPPLRLWHLPRPWGLRIGLLAAGYLLQGLNAGEGVRMLGALMWQAFFLCYGVQGLAAMNFAQHRRGTGRLGRRMTVALALVFRFVQVALVIVGVFDQFSNTRGLRPPLRPRNEEE